MRVEGLGLRIGLRRHGLLRSCEKRYRRETSTAASAAMETHDAISHFRTPSAAQGSTYCAGSSPIVPPSLFAIGKHDLADHPHRRAPHARSEGDRDLIPRMQCFGIPAALFRTAGRGSR